MRKDIQINTSINDIVLEDTNKNKKTYPFKWVLETDRHLVGQITIPHNYDVKLLQSEGVKVEIPYTPIYKAIKVRIVRNYDTDTNIAVINPVNGSDFFEIHTLLKGTDIQIRASQLLMINPSHYIVQIDNKNGIGFIWSGLSLDAVNVPANEQNRDLLLQCIPSNNYRYPISGVGLVRYLHANLAQTDLANVLQNEFTADKVMVNSAAFNTFTGDIDLDLDYSEADENT